MGTMRAVPRSMSRKKKAQLERDQQVDVNEALPSVAAAEKGAQSKPKEPLIG